MWSDEVKAFMKFERERGNILKNGSRIGYLKRPRGQHQVIAGADSLKRSDLLLAAAESGMLQNMGHTCGVRRVRLEADAENIVLVFSCDMKVIRVCFVMS